MTDGHLFRYERSGCAARAHCSWPTYVRSLLLHQCLYKSVEDKITFRRVGNSGSPTLYLYNSVLFLSCLHVICLHAAATK